jgi:hypothetical protein
LKQERIEDSLSYLVYFSLFSFILKQISKHPFNGHKLLDKVEEFSGQCLQVLDIAGAREHSVEFPKGEKSPI